MTVAAFAGSSSGSAGTSHKGPSAKGLAVARKRRKLILLGCDRRNFLAPFEALGPGEVPDPQRCTNGLMRAGAGRINASRYATPTPLHPIAPALNVPNP